MNARETLKKHFNAEEGSFLLLVRCELRWDWAAFRELTAAMFTVADELRGKETIETWIAHGFWFCDSWIPDSTAHPNFPRPEAAAYNEAIQLIHDLAHLLFVGESPYEDDTLRMKAIKGI